LKSVGIEITPQFIRGALLDVASQSLLNESVVSFPAPIHHQPESFAEVNPAAIVQLVLATINTLCEPAESDVEIWISGRAGGLILADESGRAKSNFISWSDRRTQQLTVMNKSHLDRLADQWSDPKFDQLRRELHPSSMLAMLYTLADNGSLPDGVLPLTIHDFFISHLCQQPGTMHCTLGVGLLDFQTNDWFYKALERAGLGDLWLPEITLGLDYVGRIKSGKRTIHFRPPISELQTTLLGNQFSSKEIGISLTGNPRISAIQYGNGALSQASVPYFEQQRLITIALSEQLNIEKEIDEDIPSEKCCELAEQCASVAAGFINLDRFESILIAGCPNEASHRVAEAFSTRFQKTVRLSEVNAGLKGLLRLAQR
jgi:hypothetical protein